MLENKLGESIVYDEINASVIRDDPRNESELNLLEFLNDPKNYFLAINFIPRTPEGRVNYASFGPKYMDQGVKKYINDDEVDPHLMYDMAQVATAIEEVGFDPCDGTTVATQNNHSLIVFGTDNGFRLKQAIESIDPLNLYVFVSSWDELISSFWSIDWVDLWNKYCNDPMRKIIVYQSTSSVEIKSVLQGHGYLTLDHALILRGLAALPQTNELSDAIQDDQLARAALYTGFVMDEYNMIWNSWKSLRISPRVFINPKSYDLKPCSGLRAVVTASGPSLDSQLEFLKSVADDHIIIACASSYGTLATYGIEPDILCLLERGDFMIDQYKQASQIMTHKQSRLLASTTTPAEIFQYFKNPMIYFRSQLTPTGLFADGKHSILPYEGPQTVNTGVALACCLGFDSVLLVGADLGTADLSNVRSKNAVGETPRDFPISIKGNLVETVFTNDMLVDGKRAIEECIKFHSESQSLYNISNGVYIDGFEPIQAQSYVELLAKEKKKVISKHVFYDWWDSAPFYSYEKFNARLRAMKPRRIVFNYIEKLSMILSSDEPWIPTKFNKIEEYFNLTTIPLRDQFAVRVIRGQVIRFCISVYRQVLVMKKANDSKMLNEFLKKAELILQNRLQSMQCELLELIDQLESPS